MNRIRKIIDEISADEIANHIKNLEGVRHPVEASEALDKAGEYIWQMLLSCGFEMTAHYFDEDGREYKNILGTLRGNHQPDKKVAVLAHYDTVPNSPGANDNASGVAAVLEAARVLRGVQLKKSVLFIAVNLEERKDADDKNSPFMRGSNALANHAWQEGWQLEGVVDFEEIAYAGDDILQSKPENFPLDLPKAGNFIGIIGNQNSSGLVKDYINIITQYKIPLPYLPMVVPGNGEMVPDVRRSDHAAFWDRGFPAIMLTDTANFRTPHYHQPTDVFDTLNIPFATEVCRAACGMVINMAGLDE